MHSQIYGCPLFPEMLEPPFLVLHLVPFYVWADVDFSMHFHPAASGSWFFTRGKNGSSKKTHCITYGYYKRNFTAILWIVRIQFAQDTASLVVQLSFITHGTPGPAWMVLPYQRQTTNTSSDPTPLSAQRPKKCSTDHCRYRAPSL